MTDIMSKEGSGVICKTSVEHHVIGGVRRDHSCNGLAHGLGCCGHKRYGSNKPHCGSSRRMCSLDHRSKVRYKNRLDWIFGKCHHNGSHDRSVTKIYK